MELAFTRAGDLWVREVDGTERQVIEAAASPAWSPRGTWIAYASSMAEFRVQGLPAVWTATATPAATANIVLGNPMADGVTMGFASPPTGPCVVLYTLEITPSGVVDMAALQVTQHATPFNVLLPCPVLNSNGCFPDHPVCADGGTMFVNNPVPCTVAVAAGTWSSIKRLYAAP